MFVSVFFTLIPLINSFHIPYLKLLQSFPFLTSGPTILLLEKHTTKTKQNEVHLGGLSRIDALLG